MFRKVSLSFYQSIFRVVLGCFKIFCLIFMFSREKRNATGGKSFRRYVNSIDASSEKESNKKVEPKTPTKKQQKKEGLCVPFSIGFPSRICTKYLLCRNGPQNVHQQSAFKLAMTLLHQNKILRYLKKLNFVT